MDLRPGLKALASDEMRIAKATTIMARAAKSLYCPCKVDMIPMAEGLFCLTPARIIKALIEQMR